jgi:phage shock protein A
MVVLFAMKNDQANIACAISTDAMDQLGGSSRTPPAQREQQFLRLRDRIEERAARKFSDVEPGAIPPA